MNARTRRLRATLRQRGRWFRYRAHDLREPCPCGGLDFDHWASLAEWEREYL